MILIDIDMPDCCMKCPLYEHHWDYSTCYITGYSIGYEFNPYVHRMSTCPLKENNNNDE